MTFFKQIKESGELKMNGWLKWVLGIVFSFGIAYASILKIPAIESKVNDHEVRISIIEKTVDQKLDRILERLPRRSR